MEDFDAYAITTSRRIVWTLRDNDDNFDHKYRRQASDAFLDPSKGAAR
jgi:hypothetical protein